MHERWSVVADVETLLGKKLKETKRNAELRDYWNGDNSQRDDCAECWWVAWTRRGQEMLLTGWSCNVCQCRFRELYRADTLKSSLVSTTFCQDIYKKFWLAMRARQSVSGWLLFSISPFPKCIIIPCLPVPVSAK